MGKLKPIGSEKLTGEAKIKRMLEIARFNEVIPSSVNENARTEYNIPLADGNDYQIVKEKQGYIIKKTISESQTEYIEPIKNRKYYSSYSQALKRLNLLAGELNRLNENEEGVSLFGEQKKFVLKTPKPEAPAADIPAPPPAPPAVPSPELPPSPVGDEAPMDDMGGEMGDMGMDAGMDMGMDAEMDMGPEGGEMEVDAEVEAPGEEGQVTFKTIQKLTGKLTQKIRVLDSDEGMTSEDIKYVINMVLSALDLTNLSEEDKEDILSKFEEGAEDLEGDDLGGEDMTDDTEVEDIQASMDTEIPSDAGEMTERDSRVFTGIFQESKVDKVLSKYFEYTKKEILESKEKKERKISKAKSQMNAVVRMSETIEQELASAKFLEENYDYAFVGRTNKKNLVFERGDKQIKISPQGHVLL